MPQADPIDARLTELESKIERVRVLYELYFQGMEKVEPTVARTSVERLVREIQSQAIRNTGYRFRFNSLVQRLTSYQAHWQRTSRQIEEGTYARDLKRVERRRVGRGLRENTMANRLVARRAAEEAEPAEPAAFLTTPGGGQNGATVGAPATTSPAPASSAPPSPPTVAPRRPPAIPSDAKLAARQSAALAPVPATPPEKPLPFDETNLRNFYDRLVAAKRETGEQAPAPYERVAAALRIEAGRIAAEKQARGVEFDVFIRDGRVMIRPKLKR